MLWASSDDDGDGATSEEEEYIRTRWDEEDMEEELEGPTMTSKKRLKWHMTSNFFGIWKIFSNLDFATLE